MFGELLLSPLYGFVLNVYYEVIIISLSLNVFMQVLQIREYCSLPLENIFVWM